MRRKENELILVIHNVRSSLNTGALFRTADGAGVRRIFLTGYTPAPPRKDALSLTAAEKAFRKTALGAEASMPWKQSASFGTVLAALRKEKFEIVALEQHEKSADYRAYVPKPRVALVVGNEVRGLHANILRQCDAIIDIPMRGKKNSLNVSAAAGIALYQIASTMERGGE